MSVRVLIAGPADVRLFDTVAEDVFDGPLMPELLTEFINDPRHHIAIAVDQGAVVGMVTGVHYIHPDKPPQLWINELGVASGRRREGIATRLFRHMLDHARSIGCSEAWVVADQTEEAIAFYQSLDAKQTGTDLAMFSFPLKAERP